MNPEEPTHRVLSLLRMIAETHAPAALAASLGAEDMVLIDLLARHRLPIEVFTLDTGRLPEETHSLIHATRQRYRIPITVITPDAADIERYVAANGPNAFYDSQALRLECCFLRKVKPLRRAIAGKQAWITGQRRAQSVTRRDLAVQEWDAEHGLPKFNPLADWSDDSVWAYIRQHSVPYNALHDRGYPSIGCAPCTRAIAPGEDQRAGRWWWESAEHRECGLHPHRKAS
ncbi:MAG TPA: phosphoadenylyl-sulfate reductase [Stellaceae bacterium]|nr:phosphoadenylyl-sulfate reductase [Stellaceae bacterium]